MIHQEVNTDIFANDYADLLTFQRMSRFLQSSVKLSLRFPSSILAIDTDCFKLCRALIPLVQCERGTACGDCSACGYFSQALLALDPASSLSSDLEDVLWITEEKPSVKDIEKVLDFVRIYPRFRTRLVVILNAERMSVAAANRLLKTLEEPPAGATIFLQTGAVRRLLPTIRSRCQVWSFPTALALSREVELLMKELFSDAGLSPDREEALLSSHIDWSHTKSMLEVGLNKSYRQKIAAPTIDPSQKRVNPTGKQCVLSSRRKILYTLHDMALQKGIQLNPKLWLRALIHPAEVEYSKK